jgi:hypothetical protein
MDAEIWVYRETAGYVPGAQLVGYKVEASDGSVGKIDKHTEDVGRSYIVVDTGPWIFGRRVVLPAGLVSKIDTENETVHVSCSKKEIKDSPDFESGQHEDDITFITLVEQYYSNRHV